MSFVTLKLLKPSETVLLQEREQDVIYSLKILAKRTKYFYLDCMSKDFLERSCKRNPSILELPTPLYGCIISFAKLYPPCFLSRWNAQNGFCNGQGKL